MTDTVAVANFRTRVEAELAARLLDSRQIPYVINSLEAMAHGPLGPGTTILVRAADAAVARELLASTDAESPTRVVVVAQADSRRDADRMVAALARAGILALTRASPVQRRKREEIAVFVRRDQMSRARRVLAQLPAGEP